MKSNTAVDATIQEHHNLLVYEPRSGHASTWPHYLVKMLPNSRMTVVGDFAGFLRALANPKHDYTTIIINWEVASPSGEVGTQRLSAVRNIERYKNVPVCIFAESAELDAKSRFFVGGFLNVFLTLGHATPRSVVGAMRPMFGEDNKNIDFDDAGLRSAEVMIKNEEFSAAIAYLQGVTPARKFLIMKYLLLIKCYIATLQPAMAKSLFEELIKLQVHSPQLFCLGSKIYELLGNSSWALQFGELRYRSYQDDGQAAIDYASLLAKAGQVAAAKSLLLEQIEKTSVNKASIYSALAVMHATDFEFEKIKVLAKADWDFSLSHEAAKTVLHSAVIYAKKQRYEEAIIALEVCVRFLDDQDLKQWAYFKLGRCLYMMKHYGQALDFFCQSLILAPYSDRTARAIGITRNKIRSLALPLNKETVWKAVRERIRFVNKETNVRLHITVENAIRPYGLGRQNKRPTAGKTNDTSLQNPSVTNRFLAQQDIRNDDVELVFDSSF